MVDIKGLRRLAQAAQPEKVSELLARLESAESEVTEQARLNGVGAERELALMTKLEAAEKERDALLGCLNEWKELTKDAEKERDALKAKIEAMEKQEPVGTAFLCVQCDTPFDGEYYCPKCSGNTATEENVYALPGAQDISLSDPAVQKRLATHWGYVPAPSVPEKVEVREDEGHIFSRGSYNEGYDNGWNDCCEAMRAAAAPEIEP